MSQPIKKTYNEHRPDQPVAIIKDPEHTGNSLLGEILLRNNAVNLPKLNEAAAIQRRQACSESQLDATVISHCAAELTHKAETSVPATQSCRSFRRSRFVIGSFLAFSLIVIAAWHSLHLVTAALLTIIGVATLSQTGLRLICLITAVRMARRNAGKSKEKEAALAIFDARTVALPTISLLVPLYKEANVVPKLAVSLSRLNYPRHLTDILIIVEIGDQETRAALQSAELPPWMRVIEVPAGVVKTKPRALSYALNFCRGEIIGILDAEDRPDTDQLYHIARHFFHAPADVGCLQGKLDYFNSETNWLSRCFTIEYAAWFRVMLPGFAKLGLAIPLGGTTCYFRRKALDDVGAWDAWNVTEDADLGVRLNRRGWKTEIIDTTTDEEPNCRTIPWIKQRSRWLKGYAMTFATHMRTPVKLWRDLGTKRFIGFQLQFLMLLTQFLTAPAIWGFWLLSAGQPYLLEQPLYFLLGANALIWLFAICVVSELVAFLVDLLAIRGAKHRHLRFWVPTMHLYFPLATIAAWKAVYELFTRPFYWDKTAHGVIAAQEEQLAVKVPFQGQIGADYTMVRKYQRRAAS